ncbi:NUDIX domain-containing protein [Oceaniglobus roseus]|uniref:NUDIX domain-containing protein n=1 Tax=Oceaniglobus roseus TaxID=1737570 RepID=UPI000C7F2A1A|nr:NUDIX domain-containing protein [Kandeliimicrobium roseum]
MTSDLFLFGTLLDDELRGTVAGRPLAGVPAVLPGQGIWRAADGDYPVLGAGEAAPGLLFRDVPEAALARLHYYEQGFGYDAVPVRVRAGTGESEALAYRAQHRVTASGGPWRLDHWQAAWGALTRRAALEAMSLFGRIDGTALAGEMQRIRVRADAALRAETRPAPMGPRAGLSRDAVTVVEARRPFVSFFAVEDSALRYPRFDGGTSARLHRTGLHSGDAVTVLPYDPVRRRVLLVEQFRYGAFLRGDPFPWCLEPVAGFIDPGETPEEAARRETVEEAHLAFDRLVPIGSGYPSPGALSEYLYQFVGLCDLPDPEEGRGGLAEEGEDIRTHVVALQDLIAMTEDGTVDSAPLMVSALWLDRAVARGDFG